VSERERENFAPFRFSLLLETLLRFFGVSVTLQIIYSAVLSFFSTCLFGEVAPEGATDGEES
jgi:hypothetical protein